MAAPSLNEINVSDRCLKLLLATFVFRRSRLETFSKQNCLDGAFQKNDCVRKTGRAGTGSHFLGCAGLLTSGQALLETSSSGLKILWPAHEGFDQMKHE